MRIPPVLMFAVLFTGCTASASFAERETAVINSYPEGAIMRLYTTEDTEDMEILRRVSDPLDASAVTSPEYRRLLKGMLATVQDPSNQGVGIAAPQVGINKQVIAVQRFDKEGEPFGFYVNPVITEASEEMVPSTEGCLSIPGKSGCVMRHKSIVIRYNDPKDYTLHTEHIDGFTAIIFQHETDHLNGILFTDNIITLPQEPNGEN